MYFVAKEMRKKKFMLKQPQKIEEIELIDKKPTTSY